MPYPAPADVSAVTEVEWHLVCLPVDEAYKIAAWDAYTNLANRWMWGMDEPHPDQEDIEQQWLNAIGLTMEEIGMSKLDTIIGHIDELEALLAGLEMQQCCDNPALTFGIENPISDSGYDYHAETFPATWGDGETIADIDDYREVLCAMAHRMVDYLASVGAQLDAAIEDGVLGMSILSGIMAEISGLGFLVVGLYAAVAAVLTQLGIDWFTDMLGDAGDAIETAREDIVCAFLSNDVDTLRDAVEDEITALAWSTFFTHIDYQSAINAAQTGIWQGEYIEIARNDTCDCLFPSDFVGEWIADDLDIEPWDLQGRAEFGGDASCPDTGNVKMNPCTAGNAIARNLLENAADKAGFTWPASPRIGWVDYFEVTYDVGSNYASEGKTLEMIILYKDGTSDTKVLPVTAGEHTETLEGDHGEEVQADGATNQWCVQIRELNTVGVCNDIDAQVCFTAARVWGRVQAV